MGETVTKGRAKYIYTKNNIGRKHKKLLTQRKRSGQYRSGKNLVEQDPLSEQNIKGLEVAKSLNSGLTSETIDSDYNSYHE